MTKQTKQTKARKDARRGVRMLGLALLLGVAAVAGVLVQAHGTAQAANLDYHWQSGYYLDNGWLCYGWSNGSYHCTQRWHRDSSGHLVSDNPSWVPNVGGGTGAQIVTAKVTSSNTPAVAGVLNEGFCAGKPVSFANVSEWAVPNGCYSGVYYPNPANYPYRPSWGWCNWWPEEMNLQYAGSDALNRPGHSAPRIGAVIWYPPLDQGASMDGHYGTVVAIGPGGWLLSAEMNFQWRGGGWGRVIYRYVHMDGAISFRY